MNKYLVTETGGFCIIEADQLVFNEATGEKLLFIGKDLIAVLPIQVMVRIEQDAPIVKSPTSEYKKLK